jgi:hypothetical protein
MLNSKKTSLIILAITSLICSRAMFAFFNDPEGPNLLIVVGMAAILFVISLLTYSFRRSVNSFKRLVLAIFVQIVLVFVFYFCLR